MKEYNSQEELVRLFKEHFGKNISPDGSVNGGLYLWTYEHPLPNSIVSTWFLHVTGYKYPLPDSIVNVEGNICLNNNQKLPKNLNIDKVEKIYYYI